MKTCIILTGGKGTRLSPMTLKTPKPMLDICGKPHLERQVMWAKDNGFKHIIFSAGYLHESIREYFGDGSEFGVEIEYVLDGDKPLGTAGAIKNCENLVRSENFMVLNGDILCDAELRDIYESHIISGLRVTLTLVPVDDPSRFGVILTDENGLITDFLEKPKNPPSNYINAGLYVMNVNVFHSIPRDTYCMVETDLFPQYAGIRFLNAYKYDGYWLDMGTTSAYVKAFYDGRMNGALNLSTPKYKPLKFTDNMWKGTMGLDFTFDNVLRLTRAIAQVVDGPISLAHDDRYLSKEFYDLMKQELEIHSIDCLDDSNDVRVFIGSNWYEPYINSIEIECKPELLDAIKLLVR